MIYQDFLDRHKLDKKTVKPLENQILEKFLQRLSPGLLELISNFGFFSVDKGMAWLVDPKEWIITMEEFMADSVDSDSVPFMRSSFGDVYFINSADKIFRINPLLGKISEVTGSMDAFFVGILCMESYYNNAFLKKLFNQAHKKLGTLGADEIYGFEPLLSLGGSEDAENMVKVKAREHLSLIAQTL